MHAYLRTAHRAGADPRGRGQGDRRRHPRPGPVVAAGHADRQGSPYRLDADADAHQCRPRHGAHHRDWSHADRDGATSRTPSARVGPGRGLSQFAQRHCRARWSSPSTSARPTRRSSTTWRRGIEAEARRRSPPTLGLGIEIEAVGHFDPVTFDAELRRARSATRPSGSATRTATSSPAPATTPAGSTASRRRRWSCAPASTGSRTTRPRRSRRNGPPTGADVLFHAVVETAEIVE